MERTLGKASPQNGDCSGKHMRSRWSAEQIQVRNRWSFACQSLCISVPLRSATHFPNLLVTETFSVDFGRISEEAAPSEERSRRGTRALHRKR